MATNGMGISGGAPGEGALKNATLIAGPTASGKSALALDLARRTGGVIVNVDSMQVYGVLRLLTARPDDAELAQAPHHLYGHVDPARTYSTGHWLADVSELIADKTLGERPAIFVGGTGLYFRALLDGLSEMPQIPDAVRQKWRGRLAEQGPEALHGLLLERDAASAARLSSTDGQRIVRALEVLEASGRSITDWQSRPGGGLVDRESARRIVLVPDRAELARRVAERFDGMIEAGALEEVRALAGLGLPHSMPAMKAIGVPELLAVLEGTLDIETARERAKAATRQYAKRQMTWFRNQFDDGWERLDTESTSGAVSGRALR